MERKKSSQINYGISILRILATFSVIVIHISGPQVVKFGKISNFDWHVANIYDSVSRYAVPVFFMISGALLLGRTFEIKDFIKNRLGKIIPPFLFWSFFYSLMNRYYFNHESFSVSKVVKDVFYGSEYHLWFIYVLIGLYLIAPIFQKWIQFSNKQELQYFLIIWIFTLFLSIPGVAIYFPKINFIYFSGFIGYFVLGYYLNRYVEFPKWISYLIIFIGVAITIFGTCLFSYKTNKFFDYFYEYLNINAFFVAVGVFSLFNKIENVNDKMKPLLSNLNACSFGIFLIHPFLINIFAIIGLFEYTINSIIDIFIISIACFTFSFLVIFIIKKIKLGNLIA